MCVVHLSKKLGSESNTGILVAVFLCAPFRESGPLWSHSSASVLGVETSQPRGLEVYLCGQIHFSKNGSIVSTGSTLRLRDRRAGCFSRYPREMVWEARVAERQVDSLGAVALDADLRIISVSDGVVQHSGIPADELIGRHAIELVHPDDVQRAGDVLDEVRETPGDRPEGMYRLRVADGSYRFFTLRATNLGPDEDNAVLLSFDEPTPRVRAESFADDAVDALRMLSEELSLEESFEWIARVAERHVEGLQIVITTFVADGPNRIFSRRPVPPPIREVNVDADPQRLPTHVEAALEQSSRRRWRSSRKIASLDSIVPGRLTSILADRDDRVVGYIEALRDTTEAPSDSEWLVHGMISRMMTAALHRYEFDRQLRDAADIDPLTGLLNRRRLFEALQNDRSLAGSSLYLIDLDRFSWVNNNLGHKAGDETLIAVADALRSVCPPQGLIARLGGDEFVVWIPLDHGSDSLEELGNRISSAMVVPAGIGDKRVLVRASIGMVRINPGEAAADALNRADAAMYGAKRSGGDSARAG